jgi:hypothetical protein
MAEPLFPASLYVQVPAGLPEALTAVAARQHTKRSDFVRQVLIREIEAAGVSLPDPERAAS